MTFDEFKAKYNGVGIDFDGAYGFQCMDLMHRYIVDVLGLSGYLFAAPTAYEAYLNANDSRFEKIDNTPTAIPQKGDIIFWKSNITGVTGSAGHVAVFDSGDVNSFNSFDQNYPTGSTPHIQHHSYAGLAGWLHFKGTALVDPVITPDEAKLYYETYAGREPENTQVIQNRHAIELLKGLALEVKGSRDNLNKQVADLQSQLNDTKNQFSVLTDKYNTDLGSKQVEIDQLNKKLIDANSNLSIKSQQLSDTQKQLADTQNQLTDSQDKLTECQNQPPKIVTNTVTQVVPTDPTFSNSWANFFYKIAKALEPKTSE